MMIYPTKWMLSPKSRVESNRRPVLLWFFTKSMAMICLPFALSSEDLSRGSWNREGDEQCLCSAFLFRCWRKLKFWLVVKCFQNQMNLELGEPRKAVASSCHTHILMFRHLLFSSSLMQEGSQEQLEEGHNSTVMAPCFDLPIHSGQLCFWTVHNSFILHLPPIPQFTRKLNTSLHLHFSLHLPLYCLST